MTYFTNFLFTTFSITTVLEKTKYRREFKVKSCRGGLSVKGVGTLKNIQAEYSHILICKVNINQKI